MREEIKNLMAEIEAELALITEWPWVIVPGRESPPRYDVLSESFKEADPKNAAVYVPKIIAHSHLVAPKVEVNPNCKIDLEFISKAPERLNKLISFIKEKHRGE